MLKQSLLCCYALISSLSLLYRMQVCVVKGTQNGSGLLPSPQPVYATAKILKWQFYQINNFEVRKMTINILKILFLYILNMLNIKRLALIATEI